MKFSLIAIASLFAANAVALDLQPIITQLDKLVPDTADCLNPCRDFQCILGCVGNDVDLVVKALDNALSQ